ncbi:hypothetical protein TRAPUB_12236 [Trametes pubescens]|uniref:Uncharacterized protein n=1 Tax=Trametes pubescens TaxID=154538 RepID=A0A1M2VUM5_TRAPU|nr:hypothetical protein TRAPUB_12236 [Trametes pubescens]
MSDQLLSTLLEQTQRVLILRVFHDKYVLLITSPSDEDKVTYFAGEVTAEWKIMSSTLRREIRWVSSAAGNPTSSQKQLVFSSYLIYWDFNRRLSDTCFLVHEKARSFADRMQEIALSQDFAQHFNVYIRDLYGNHEEGGEAEEMGDALVEM